MFNFYNYTIKQKITWLLIAYFIMAIIAITSTLFVSWRLEGGAAAINDSGSERMLSYRIGFLLAQHIIEPSDSLKTEIFQTITSFEKTLTTLETGDTSRPLLLPKDVKVRSALKNIQQTWDKQNKDLVYQILNEANKEIAQDLLGLYRDRIETIVDKIDALVVMVERSQERATNLLRSFQIAMLCLALAGTILLIYLFMRVVISPVRDLQVALSDMGKRNFSTRLPIKNYDELGDLAIGFNQMAEQLQESYTTLEDRVKDKTKNLEMKQKELTALYDATSFLNSSSDIEILCQGVLDKMLTLFKAKSGVIRLTDHKHDGMPIIAYQGVSQHFLKAENQLHCGDCLCGETAKFAKVVSCNLSEVINDMPSEQNCLDEGIEGLVSVPIRVRQRTIGVLNLFFQQRYILPRSDVKILEIVSQHLGGAIESQRFIEREKELAISEERNLLAQELHDSIAQSLAFLNIQAQLLQDGLSKGKSEQVTQTLSQIKEGIQESYDDVRELLLHFRTRVEHDDIDVAIRDILNKFEVQTGIKTDYQYQGNTLTLQPETILQVVHILHESLSNIRKHARASLVRVRLINGNECVLSIHDNGVGFDNNKDAGETHVGLRIMKERASRINAALTIDSSNKEGTTIHLTLPITTYALAANIAN